METECHICGHKHCCHENTKTSKIVALNNQGEVIVKDGLPREFIRENCAEKSGHGQWLGDTTIH